MKNTSSNQYLMYRCLSQALMIIGRPPMKYSRTKCQITQVRNMKRNKEDICLSYQLIKRSRHTHQYWTQMKPSCIFLSLMILKMMIPLHTSIKLVTEIKYFSDLMFMNFLMNLVSTLRLLYLQPLSKITLTLSWIELIQKESSFNIGYIDNMHHLPMAFISKT